MTLYLDYSATTPAHPEVADLVHQMMTTEYGNTGSRTHEFGVAAKRAVEIARGQVAEVAAADKTEVVFTSGATESNNIAILGMREYAERTGKKHIITTKIEHKAVLEPIAFLEKQGFEVTYLEVDSGGRIDLSELKNSIKEKTVLVSIMHVNNETGTIQALDDICAILDGHEAYLHVDAAQSFGKFPNSLRNQRIDFISASGHKLYAPKGIGALIVRRRGYLKPPLTSLMFGGGQEKGLRPGTLPSPLICGFGLACALSKQHAPKWKETAEQSKKAFLTAIADFGPLIHGEPASPYILNFSIPNVNSEAAMVKFKGIIAVSNGSACTSASYTQSHVLTAMHLTPEQISGAIRVSFGIAPVKLPIEEIRETIKSLL